jgi:tRNA(Ile)-lysidine synthase
MNKSLSEQAFHFFERHIDPQKPILLGLSGGPDSLCLLHLLIEYKTKKPFDLRLIHVDHGWRDESKKECEELKKLAVSLNLTLYTTRLDPREYKGNLEALSREGRLAYFSQIAEEINAQGVLLAHHQIDQQETVLKRFLEGAHLVHLAGMKKSSKIGTLSILRPLLGATKEEILQFLNTKNISYFEDPTNSDTRFLRAKMRKEIFPYLREAFGKEFQENLCKIALDAQELGYFLDEKLGPFLKNPVTSDLGVLYDLHDNFPASQFEIRELFRKIAQIEEFKLNRYQIELAAKLFLENAANKAIEAEDKYLYIDRRRIFISKQPENKPDQAYELKEGRQQFGSYSIEVKEMDPGQFVEVKNDWRSFWQGSMSTVLPLGKYVIEPLRLDKRRIIGDASKDVDKALNEKKVPRFLASLCPVISQENKVFEDFLCGYKHYKNLFLKRFLYIQMERGKNLRFQDFP